MQIVWVALILALMAWAGHRILGFVFDAMMVVMASGVFSTRYCHYCFKPLDRWHIPCH